jgi:hypothetical protein
MYSMAPTTEQDRKLLEPNCVSWSRVRYEPVCALRKVCTVHTACGLGSVTTSAFRWLSRCSAGLDRASATIS